jgi:hypothetical protein
MRSAAAYLISATLLIGCAAGDGERPPTAGSQLAAAADMSRPANSAPVVCANGQAQHVRFANFWAGAPGWPLGTGMRWEWWAMGEPWASGGYFVADGYGGGHAILDGGINGNIMFNQGKPDETIVSFTADDGPPPGVFSVIDTRVQHDSFSTYSIVQRQNGVPVARTYIPAGLQRTTAGAGSGTLDVFGSDHSNAVGCISQLRAWDTSDATDVGPAQAYIPQRRFDNFGPGGEPVDLLVDFMQPILGPYADLSSGYDSGGAFPRRSTHVGIPSAGNDYTDASWVPPTPTAYLPVVRWVTNAPFGPLYDATATALQAALRRGCSAHAPPAGAKLFDSFCRADQTFAHTDVPDLGSVEYSSLGARPRWRSGYPSGYAATIPTPASFLGDGGLQRASVGIYNRSPVPLDAWATATWVPSSSGDGSVEVRRRPHVGTSSDGSAGLVFRAVDEYHLWALLYYRATDGAGNVISTELYLWRWDGPGYGTAVAGYDVESSPHAAFSKISVSFQGDKITGYLDGDPVISATDSTYATATGVGLYLQSALARAYDWAAF